MEELRVKKKVVVDSVLKSRLFKYTESAVVWNVQEGDGHVVMVASLSSNGFFYVYKKVLDDLNLTYVKVEE